jgi:hypothetical protein
MPAAGENFLRISHADINVEAIWLCSTVSGAFNGAPNNEASSLDCQLFILNLLI